ncbi:transglutaminase family protein [Thiosocius teredinicola]|uniref:transglutaminase family protein n=1 Tax=Thiosocius teredinicola TaxID=1973002 RepID=UPI000990ED62
MSIRVAIRHRTEYLFDRSVALSPHLIRLRPAPHTRTPIHEYSLKVEPEEYFLNWQQDPFGNFAARYVFPEKTRKMVIDVGLVVEMVTINPFDFFVEEFAEHFPFEYPKQLHKELKPYFECTESGPRLSEWLQSVSRESVHIVTFLVELNQRLQKDIGYVIRMEPGVQTCEETLGRAKGSCRDSAWLLVQILRHLGLAARFVSGYLVQLAPDQESLDGPSGPTEDFTDLHAWAEVYVPGAGWIGLDPTSGLFAGEGHIPLACTPDYVSAAAVTGATDKCEVEFKFLNEVKRIHEDPRVTLPYSDEQWAAVMALGERVDAELTANDVRLTMGGEPTFVSIDDMDGAEWNTAALGPHKRERAEVLLRRLWKRFSPGGALHHGQGKWYPGEPLPRWALSCLWREDGTPVWEDSSLLTDPTSPGNADASSAQRFAQTLAKRLGVSAGNVEAGFEDVLYYLWKEGTLPENVDVLDSKLSDKLERARLRRLFERGLDQTVGYALPLGWDHDADRWTSSRWSFRRGHMFLLPGDSPMGLRLPLDALVWEKPELRQPLLFTDPFAPRGALPGAGRSRGPGDVAERYAEFTEGYPPSNYQTHGLSEQSLADAEHQGKHFVRTAMAFEPRDGNLHVFMPPIGDVAHWLELVTGIEDTARELGQPVVLEGYPAPHDPRLKRFSVTPDPGVIEVNVHPAHSWKEMVENNEILYEEARLSRLGTEKFMLDGRHTGTGGGNHVTLGGPSPADSPILRNPQVLGSLVRYWQNHPSLSYLFSGMFIGPTSQAPRVDEARDDSLYELNIAMQQLPPGEVPAPWLVDRVLRNLLADMTGNTHRSEFCIDKLYSPDSSTGRLGLVEFRGFEMPPHSRMAMVQSLLLRSLVSRFWKQPYDKELVTWGTELHDRFMLPHYVERDMNDVVADLQRWGYPVDDSWFEPFVEFRFPRYGTINVDDIELELRFAIEPWHVLGEEVTGQGTARFVDSSVERLQIKARGMTDTRHVVTCNGRRVPLRCTGERAEFVAGVRYKAWNPPSGLHPTIPIHAPLVFDILDTWSDRSLGGCTYYVSHPGGRNYETLPVNAYEAESRRLARFWPVGHTAGNVTAPNEAPQCDHPYTLDLRFSNKS